MKQKAQQPPHTMQQPHYTMQQSHYTMQQSQHMMQHPQHMMQHPQHMMQQPSVSIPVHTVVIFHSICQIGTSIIPYIEMDFSKQQYIATYTLTIIILRRGLILTHKICFLAFSPSIYVIGTLFCLRSSKLCM